MPDKTPKPDNIPTFEELQEQWGPDMMSFFHDMVSPDKPQDRGEDDSEESAP